MGRKNPWYHPNCADRRRSTPLTRETPRLIAAGLGAGLHLPHPAGPFQPGFPGSPLFCRADKGVGPSSPVIIYRLIISARRRNVKDAPRNFMLLNKRGAAVLARFPWAGSRVEPVCAAPPLLKRPQVPQPIGSASAMSLNTGPQVAPPPVPSSPITVMT